MKQKNKSTKSDYNRIVKELEYIIKLCESDPVKTKKKKAKKKAVKKKPTRRKKSA